MRRGDEPASHKTGYQHTLCLDNGGKTGAGYIKRSPGSSEAHSTLAFGQASQQHLLSVPPVQRLLLLVLARPCIIY